ncbi:MAG: rhodanese-like domain-containing protein [Saprospiraceae bacterium]
MKKLSFLLAVVLVLFSSCSSTAQNDSSKSSSEAQQARIDLDVAEFKHKMKEKEIVILDVRTPVETTSGKIEGAIEINVKSADFQEKIRELDKDKTYLVYCRSGRRSVKACNIMEKEGFGKLYNLIGGFNAWKTSSN